MDPEENFFCIPTKSSGERATLPSSSIGEPKKRSLSENVGCVGHLFAYRLTFLFVFALFIAFSGVSQPRELLCAPSVSSTRTRSIGWEKKVKLELVVLASA